MEQTIALNAFHNDEYNTVEYDVHSLWSAGVDMATYNALESITPGKRPFIIVRSTFAGKYRAHWSRRYMDSLFFFSRQRPVRRPLGR